MSILRKIELSIGLAVVLGGAYLLSPGLLMLFVGGIMVFDATDPNRSNE